VKIPLKTTKIYHFVVPVKYRIVLVFGAITHTTKRVPAYTRRSIVERCCCLYYTMMTEKVAHETRSSLRTDVFSHSRTSCYHKSEVEEPVCWIRSILDGCLQFLASNVHMTAEQRQIKAFAAVQPVSLLQSFTLKWKSSVKDQR